MPKYLGDVRCWVNSGKHLLSLSFSGFDPGRVKTRSGKGGAESFSQLPSSESSCQHKPTLTSTKSRWSSTRKLAIGVFTQPGPIADFIASSYIALTANVLWKVW